LGILAEINNESDAWTEVGVKNKKRVVSGSVSFQISPVSSMFGGRFRTELSKHNRFLTDSVSLQPFYSLHLDISQQHIRTVQAAFDVLFASEPIEGSEGRNGALHHRLTLETLPQILILCLKRFEFSQSASKIDRFVSFQTNFVIPQQYLFGASKLGSAPSPAYELVAVVVHHGPRAISGHYTCYARWKQSNFFQWLLFDDRRVEKVTLKDVLGQKAYLLYYERAPAVIDKDVLTVCDPSLDVKTISQVNEAVPIPKKRNRKRNKKPSTQTA